MGRMHCLFFQTTYRFCKAMHLKNNVQNYIYIFVTVKQTARQENKLNNYILDLDRERQTLCIYYII